MIKQIISKKFISLILITLLSSFYLPTSYGASKVESSTEKAISELSKKIALLELEIKLIKIQQEKTEAISRKALELVAGKDMPRTIIHKTSPDQTKVNFFVPAGW